jgi:hypothetical protein
MHIKQELRSWLSEFYDLLADLEDNRKNVCTRYYALCGRDKPLCTGCNRTARKSKALNTLISLAENENEQVRTTK